MQRSSAAGWTTLMCSCAAQMDASLRFTSPRRRCRTAAHGNIRQSCGPPPASAFQQIIDADAADDGGDSSTTAEISQKRLVKPNAE